MESTVHFVCGPPGALLLESLVSRCVERMPGDPGALLWLVPSRRAATEVAERLVARVPTGVQVPILTFEDFAAAVIRTNDPEARPLSHVQRRLLAENIVAELHRHGRLSHFAGVVDTRGFAEGVFALLRELKRHEIWPSQLARAAYRRGYRGENIESSRKGLDISAKERQCVRIYARYQQHLVRHRLFDLEGRLWYARDLLRQGRIRPFDRVRAIFVVGFAELSRTQRDVLTTWAQRGAELWIAHNDEMGEDRAEVFTSSREFREAFSHLNPRVDWLTDTGDLPLGLRHVADKLFVPSRSVRRQAEASGIHVIEAPGVVGEVRLVARAVKGLLRQGTPAREILLVVRDLVPYADLIREIFDEYGLPLEIEGTHPLLRNPAVAALLRFLRLPDEGWTFAAVTAVLRNTYFRPEWEEMGRPDVALRAEALIRLLGEARGREAFLTAVDGWADRLPEGPADEQAEVSRRLRIHRLAQECRAFLQRFFRAWDGSPVRASLEEHLAWLERFAADLGLIRVSEDDVRDKAALRRLFDEVISWDRLSRSLYSRDTLLDRLAFFRILTAIAVEAGLPRTERGPGRVRLLSAELARSLHADHVFLMGLGERSFPRLVAAEPIFDEAERQGFKMTGLAFPCVGDRLPEEMLLFLTLATRARRQLTLSYPAVDERGQTLLPSTFLATLQDLFEPGAIPVTRQRMLIEGMGTNFPLSPAEHRVRAAVLLASGERLPAGLPPELASHLRIAATVAHQRFVDREHGPYDGLLRHPTLIAELQGRFGGERVLSPTALETYIACPHRFLLEHVLHLEPLEEPGEDIEGSDRGLVFHRALAWFHRTLQAKGVHGPSENHDPLLLDRLDFEIKDHSRHSSRAAEALWLLEGQRLRRKAERYRRHWQEFVATWAAMKVIPHPTLFEKGFGMEAVEGDEPGPPLVIIADGVEVRLGGRIDRVDVAETEEGVFFWIVDYKTGRSSHYSATSLRTFQRLQLTLYALAVERVLLVDKQARPLGLAYWLVTDSGPKIVLPGDYKHQGWFRSAQEWTRTRTLLEEVVGMLVKNIREGTFPLAPRSDTCTETCAYSQICRIAQSRGVDKSWHMPLPVL